MALFVFAFKINYYNNIFYNNTIWIHLYKA